MSCPNNILNHNWKEGLMRYRHGTTSKRLCLLFVTLSLVCLPILVQPRPAQAASIMVNSLADSGGSCPTTCTLRAAIASANAGDTIAFSVTGTITLTGGTLTIGKNLTINNSG